MGFLDKLRSGGDLTVGVTLDPPEPAPGGEVRVRFDIGGELDDKCRGVRVGVTGTARYLVKGRDRAVNDNIKTREVWRTLDLHEEEHSYPAAIGPGEAILTLPADAPPASADAVEWIAFARVDREKGRDAVTEVPLPVRQAQGAAPGHPASETGKDGLTVLGETEELEFSVTVPDAGPTTAHQFARVEWRLEAVLDRRLRGDLAVETPLVVL